MKRSDRQSNARGAEGATLARKTKRRHVPIRLRPPKREEVTRALAWGVHLYTAMGLVAAAGMAVLIVRGGHPAFHGAFVLMFAATFIDATDGTLARRIKIRETLPGFDGRKLDDLTDYLNYTALPLLLIWRPGILPQGQEWWLVFPLLASAYGFCQVSAKTEDGYFLGFPSLWNVVAFYLYVLRLDAWLALTIVLVLSLLTFVPSRHLYPSQPGRLNRWGLILGTFWACSLVWVLWRMPFHPPDAGRIPSDSLRSVALISLCYPAYYMFASWGLSLRLWLRARS